MAYTDEGQYFFQPEIDSEDSQALEQVERLNQAANYKRMKNLQAQESKMSQDLLEQALEESGLTQAEYQKLFYEDPETSKQLLSEGMKHVTKNLAARKIKKPQPRQKGEQAEPKEQQRKPNEVVQAAREKVNKGSNLTQEEELEVIGSLVGRL